MPPATPRAAVYVRISRDRSGAGLGVDRQLSDCRELADRIGATITEVHSDNDLSAFGGKLRPGYRALLDSLRAGQVDVLICWHVDRLTRRPAELEQLIDVVDRAGATVATVTGGDLDLSSPSGRMVARLLGTVARHEVEHAIERMRSAKDQAAADGRWRGGSRPFGFEPDGVAVREPEAAVIRDVTTRLLGGESLRGLARELNDAGVHTSTGATWTPNRLRQVVTRGRNAGLVVTKSGAVIGPARWAAIVDEARWRNLCRVLADPARRTLASSSPVHLGSGLYRCSVCAAAVVSTRNNGHRAYACPESHVTRAAEGVDGAVETLTVARLSQLDAHLLLAPTEQRVDVEQLHDRRADAEARLREAAGMFADGAVTGPQLHEVTVRVRAEVARLDVEIGAHSAHSPLVGVVGADDVAQAWAAASVPRRKAIVDDLMRVTIHPAPKGRPAGWKPGTSYFDPASVQVEWRR